MQGIRLGLAALGVLLLIFFIIIKRPIDTPAKTTANEAKVEIPPNPYLVELVDTVDTHIKNLIAKKKVPGVAVAIVHQGNTVYKKAFGVKEVNTIFPVDTNTVFRIASVSKGFAAALTGVLVSNNLLSWDDYVKEHLPHFKLKSQKQTDAVKIKHLLSHTSGLQYQAYTTLVEDGWPRDKIIHRLRDVDLISEVGRLYSYQNVAYSVIEPIIENVTQESYVQALSDRLLNPLGMDDASLTYEELKDSKNKAKPHLYRGYGRFRKIKISPTYYNVAAAGGVNASISDMEEWLKAMLGHRPDVIAPEVLNELYSPFVRTSLKERAFRRVDRPAKAYYGMGWRVVHLPQDTIVYHGGYANGYRSGIAFSPKLDAGIVILTNSSYDLPGELMADFFDLYYPKAYSIKSWRYKNVF